VNNRRAGLSVAQLARGESIVLPDAPFVHLFVATGMAEAEGAATIATGDAVRYDRAGEARVTATEPSQLLVWEMFGTAFA
jgi:redox-sensitive bicupin YhaK (pirin superfamily)